MKTKTIDQILRKARKYLTDPRHWTQGAYFSGRRNCAIGAVYRAGGYHADDMDGSPSDELTRATLRCLERTARVKSLEWWNDNPRRTHTQVLRLFDRAIKRYGAKQ